LPGVRERLPTTGHKDIRKIADHNNQKVKKIQVNLFSFFLFTHSPDTYFNFLIWLIFLM